MTIFARSLFFAAALYSICTGAEVPENDRIRIITKLTSEIIGRQHYRQQPLDAAVSARIFDQYFKVLDPNHLFFSAEDIRDFEPHRTRLAERMKAGDASFAYLVYDRFLKRFQEYCDFTEQTLKEPITFDGNDSFTPDRRKLSRAANQEELRKLWFAKLKNDLLYFRLVNRSLQNDAKEREKAEDSKVRALWEGKSPAEKISKRLRDLRNVYVQRDKVEILGLFLEALAETYGPHSGYQPPKMDEDFEINMTLSLTGIGATLTSDDGYIKVVSIVPGGPAALDGRLQPEDRIIAVTQENGEPIDVIDMSVDNAVQHIRGKAGTKVTLTILPGKKGRNAVPENITITRDKVVLKDSEAQGKIQEIPGKDGKKIKVGIISLPSFYMDFSGMFRGDDNYKSCSRDVEKILLDFQKQKVDTLVMDLRNNGGGSLPEAIRLTGLFIPSGPVVQVRQSSRKCSIESDDDETIRWEKPLVVLVNKLSASASEIFTGAIQDYRRGVVAGDTRTFGKGTVLTIIQLEQMLGYINKKFPAGSIRLETAMFFRPSGGSVQQLGVTSDLPLPSLTEKLEVGEMFSDNHL
ncbi:MAG: PDZ domain-containing protein, partial [Lentisphaeria bacterium]|nr:PDZ domain-containing protein [Lentisphaeria bacterium]